MVVSLLSYVMTVVLLPISCTSSMADWLHELIIIITSAWRYYNQSCLLVISFINIWSQPGGGCAVRVLAFSDYYYLHATLLWLDNKQMSVDCRCLMPKVHSCPLSTHRQTLCTVLRASPLLMTATSSLPTQATTASRFTSTCCSDATVVIISSHWVLRVSFCRPPCDIVSKSLSVL